MEKLFSEGFRKETTSLACTPEGPDIVSSSFSIAAVHDSKSALQGSLRPREGFLFFGLCSHVVYYNEMLMPEGRGRRPTRPAHLSRSHEENHRSNSSVCSASRIDAPQTQATSSVVRSS